MSIPLVEFTPAGSKNEPWAGQELTTSDVTACVAYLEKVAMLTFLARTRIVETTVREWLQEHRKGTSTTRMEFDEAVRLMMQGRWQ